MKYLFLAEWEGTRYYLYRKGAAAGVAIVVVVALGRQQPNMEGGMDERKGLACDW